MPRGWPVSAGELGAAIVRLVTGRPLFEAAGLGELAAAIVRLVTGRSLFEAAGLGELAATFGGRAAS